ncbi:MAG: MgtC/SapB family protein [Pseudomonadota bacterium]
MIPTHEAAIRLALALFLGAVVGGERESHGRSAGLRTHALVSLAMCLLMVISMEVPAAYVIRAVGSMLRIDPGRLAAGALAGMGFIGAGVVLKGRGSIRGVTTAASLWTVSAIGLSTGMGNYLLAVETCGLAVIVLYGLRTTFIARFVPRDFYTRLHVSGPRDGLLAAVDAALHRHGADVIFVSLTHNVSSRTSTYRFALRFRVAPDWHGLTDDVASLPKVERVIWLQGLVP